MPRALLSLIAALALLAPATGCSEDVPAAGGLSESYTVWGALDPTADTQRVRVVRITPTISTGDPAPLPVQVTSTDAATGASTAWTERTVTFPDGVVAHLYEAVLRPAFGSVHVLRVVDPERPEVSVAVRIPEQAPPPVRLPTEFTAGQPVYNVFWANTARMNHAEAWFTLQSTDCNTHLRKVELGPTLSGPVEFGWQVRLPMETIGPVLRAGLEIAPYALLGIEVRGQIAGEDWRPPGGVFDPEVIVDPAVFGNVVGGFGFVGAAYETSVAWTPTSADVTGSSFLFRHANC